MNELVSDYLSKSGMDPAQAQTLSRILSEMEARLATKEDLAAFKADLTWRMIAVVALVNGIFGTAIALANAFMG